MKCVRVLALAAAIASLVVALIYGMFLLRQYGAEGACGTNGGSRMVGDAIEIGGCW
jgi:hypothetical protein